MPPDTKEAGPSTRTGPVPNTAHARADSIVAAQVTEGLYLHADWLDLRSWSVGYCEGWDARDATLVPPWLDRLAQDLAQLDQATFLPTGRLNREQRIAREVADCRHATPVRQTDDWPAVAIPGGGA